MPARAPHGAAASQIPPAPQDAPVVVLDDPTTSLDAATARSVLAALRTVLVGRTVLLITHDPVALAVADRTVELEAGRLVRERDATDLDDPAMDVARSAGGPATPASAAVGRAR